MLNKLIQFSLTNRMFVVAAAALIMVYGTITVINLPVDVLPDLNRPRVTIFLEANGMAPEEVETIAVMPVEMAMNGAPGVITVRSSSAVGLGLIYVDFDWDMDIYRARQMVAEKLQTVELPEGIKAIMGPVSSIMGQIMNISVSGDSTNASELRTLADFTIRRRLMSIKGVSQVISIGGDRKQFQVLLSTAHMKQFNLTVDEVEYALQKSNLSTTGGFFDRYGTEVLIRSVGWITTVEDVEQVVVAFRENSPILLSQIAEVEFGPAVKRGDGSLNGSPAVILTVEKQPGANTVALTDEVVKACEELNTSLPPDVKLNPYIFQQKDFITNSLTNVEHALRDGFILVVIILFLFLLNFRTTIITLTAIPLSIVITAIIFKAFGISINTLTLGGLAIAIGELVDDAIVDVENVFRRLRENRLKENPEPALRVIYKASSEVRNSIVYATIIVVLVFLPLFWLDGMEGKIFAPLGIAYITSIIASLVVSLTVTPALCSYLLSRQSAVSSKQSWWKRKFGSAKKQTASASLPLGEARGEVDSFLVRWLKKQETSTLNWALNKTKVVIGLSVLLVVGSMAVIPFFGTEFLPPFNEGSFTVNLSAPSGTSLEESNKIGTLAEILILKVPEVEFASRRTGRAELDEHTEPVSNSEIDIKLRADAQRSRDEIIADIRKELSVIKGASVNIGQPISHRIDHLLSGVRAQVAIKLFGSDLTEMRTTAGKISEVLGSVDGVVDIQVERQVMIPQLLIKLRREDCIRYGVQVGKATEDLEIFYNGKVQTRIFEGQKTFDLVLRAEHDERVNLDNIRNSLVHNINGELIPLRQIADIEYTSVQNSISHENTLRKINVSCNVQGRDLGSAVEELQQKIGDEITLPAGAYIVYGGQFESQKSASKTISLLSIIAFFGIFMVLYHHFKSWRMVLQIMLNIPLALLGSVIAVAVTGGTFSIATMVGFITLTGIASRNGIMMISHYIHLIEHEGEKFSKQMIIRGSLERLVPVMMTALVAALALIPLTLDPQAPGKEILYPVATVILGGLISSTILNMVVIPAVFWRYGAASLKEYFANKKKSELKLETDTPLRGS
ncbi:MAG: efflux RND transporter permease subunit [Flavobacteriales bacterium]|nr:efflux RND transporter permease subunit [Flavobacteriales bacterium]